MVDSVKIKDWLRRKYLELKHNAKGFQVQRKILLQFTEEHGIQIGKEGEAYATSYTPEADTGDWGLFIYNDHNSDSVMLTVIDQNYRIFRSRPCPDYDYPLEMDTEQGWENAYEILEKFEQRMREIYSMRKPSWRPDKGLSMEEK